jgi:hypothetical protein
MVVIVDDWKYNSSAFGESIRKASTSMNGSVSQDSWTHGPLVPASL